MMLAPFCQAQPDSHYIQWKLLTKTHTFKSCSSRKEEEWLEEEEGQGSGLGGEQEGMGNCDWARNN